MKTFEQFITECNQLAELSPALLNRYKKKAKKSLAHHDKKFEKHVDVLHNPHTPKAKMHRASDKADYHARAGVNRDVGISRASQRLGK